MYAIQNRCDGFYRTLLAVSSLDVEQRFAHSLSGICLVYIRGKIIKFFHPPKKMMYAKICTRMYDARSELRGLKVGTYFPSV